MQLDLGADTVRCGTMQPSDTKDAGLAAMDPYRKCSRDKRNNSLSTLPQLALSCLGSPCTDNSELKFST